MAPNMFALWVWERMGASHQNVWEDYHTAVQWQTMPLTLVILLAGSNGCRGVQSLADYLCGIVKTPPVSYHVFFGEF